MDDLQSEKEQIEEMRAWWSEYGKVVIAGVVIGVGGLIGFNQYNASQLESQLAASELYETLVGHVVDGDRDEAEFVVDDLVANYADGYGETFFEQRRRRSWASREPDDQACDDRAGQYAGGKDRYQPRA